MKVTFLGTNGWYDTQIGNTVCVLIETSEHYLVLDAGFGFYKVRDYVKSGKGVSVFISHLHLDHLIGLHTLPLFNLPQGIDIYAPKGMIKDLRAFLRRPFTSPPPFLKTRLRFHDALRGSRSSVIFEMARLRHSVPCYGYRFSADGAVVAYCTDTGPCSGLKRLARGSDVLITECAMGPDEKVPELFHITPQTAARIAANAGAKRLALFHFDPAKYPTLDCRRGAECEARKIFPNTIATNDGTVVVV